MQNSTHSLHIIYSTNLGVSRCHPNPCSNNGLCHDTGNDYQCSCRNQHYGRHCERKNIMFLIILRITCISRNHHHGRHCERKDVMFLIMLCITCISRNRH